MLAAVDVDYRGEDRASAAAVLFASWTDPEPAFERAVAVEGVAPYEPGALYRRELPCLLAVLGAVDRPLDAVVVDAHVWLSADRRPGLGAHLHAALGIPVVGVAKSAFSGAPAEPVYRGASARPLYVTAAGMDPAEAARHVASMAGPHRLPALLKRVDRLARDAAI